MNESLTTLLNSQQTDLSNVTTTVINNQTGTYAFHAYTSIPTLERIIDGKSQFETD